MNLRRRALLALLSGVLVGAGCQMAYYRNPEADRNIRRVESGYHRIRTAPIVTVNAEKQLYAPGDPVRVTVRIVAPSEEKSLDTYLPIRGRIRVKRDRSVFDLAPLPGANKDAWAKLILDNRRQRTRSFTVTVNKVFLMRRSGWYAIWWEGTDDTGRRMRSVEAYVQVTAASRRAR